MNIYTGYYSKMSKYLENNLVPVAISRGIPDFCKDIDRMDSFMPSFQTLIDYKYKKINEKEYTRQYMRDVLYYLNPEEVYHDFEVRYGGKDVILLCYESSEKFCHRHIISDWFNNAGITVKEF